MKNFVLGVALAITVYVLSGCSASSEAEKGNYIITKDPTKAPHYLKKIPI